MPLPEELPVARVRPTFASTASSLFEAIGLHLGNALRRARYLGRWMWTILMALVVLAYVVGRLLSWTSPPRQAEPPLPSNLPPDLMQQLQGVEVIDRPSPDGSGTVKTLGRRPRPAALDESPGDEPSSEPMSDAPAVPPSTP